jgi:hypothetical protein
MTTETRRDKETGRFVHTWGVIDRVGDVEQCQVGGCDKFRQFKDGNWVYITFDEAIAASNAD